MATRGIVARHAEAIEHHHGVRHRRINPAEPVLAVEPLAHEGDRRVDRALARALRERAARPRAARRRRTLNSDRPERALGTRRPAPACRARTARCTVMPRGIARARPLRHQHQQRHDHGARPVGDLGQMEREPARQQHDLDRHHRHRAPRQFAEERELDAGEDVAVGGAAMRQDRRARPRHVRRVGRVARGLQREIGFDARREIELAAVKQRPAAMRRPGPARR